MRRPSWDNAHFPQQYYIDTSSHMKEFIGDCLDIVEKGPTVMVLDTRGHSDRWLEKRREIDGDRFSKNEDSSGVTAILIKMHVRGEADEFDYYAGKGPMAFINVQKVIERELNGKPSLPSIFFRLLRHRNTVVVGENVVKHLRRIENSFVPTLDEVFYVTMEDLTNRYMEREERGMWDERKKWEFDLDPFVNRGLLANYHRVEDMYTYLRNPYETPVELWDDLSGDMRRAQVVHALNKVFFGEALVRRILGMFEKYSFSLSIMCQKYPACKKVSRQDYRQKAALETFGGAEKHLYHEEVVWLLNTPDTDEADDPRAKQRETAKKRRRTDAYYKESRGLCVSDVSDDDDDADEALRAVKKGKAEAVARGKRVAAMIAADEAGAKNRICDPADWSRLSELAKRDSNDDTLFFAAVLNNLDHRHNNRAIKDLCSFYSGRPEFLKEALLNAMGASGFFTKENKVSALTMMGRLKLEHFHPSTLLQINAPPYEIAKFVAELPDFTRRLEIINFMCVYFSLPHDDRHVQLEACDFYCRSNRATYIRWDKPVDQLIRSLCQACNIPPHDDYFRIQRHRYICDVIEEGRQGRVSVDNAAKMVIAHTGDYGWDEGKDASTMAAPWPKLAQALHSHWKCIAGLPYRTLWCDDNLSNPVKCRHELHERQMDCVLHYLRDMASVEAMIAEVSGFLVFTLIYWENRDPRAFTVDPQLIAFGAPNQRTFAYFPISIGGEPKKAIEDFLATKVLLTRTPGFLKFYLAKPGRDIRVTNGGELLKKYAGAIDDNTLSDFVWEKRFCSVTRSEWMTDPLTVDQQHHVLYLLSLFKDFASKIGLEEIRAEATQLKH